MAKVELSRSASKLKDVDYSVERDGCDGLEDYRLVDISLLTAFISNHLVCERCHMLASTLQKQKSNMGLATMLQMSCRKCNHAGQTLDIRKIVRIIGCGHEALKRFCGILNMSCAMSSHS